ncbi:hypothetical protein [Adlercreutzia sp. ZJ304]|uniref:hypothetical protein n=1 Tax=Adlercreutzia sp. ZJ304 TaxID=2709791 RepID=UPI0013EDA0AE|nr:hypothetical protein [Adlercreutzia sp. ZJ304]
MGSTIHTYINKLIACLLSAALVVGLSPGAAFAASYAGSDSATYEDKDFNSASGQFQSDIYFIGQETFAVVDPTTSMYEREFVAGNAIEMYVKGAANFVDSLTATWKMAEAVYTGVDTPNYAAAYAAAQVVAAHENDSIALDNQTRAVVCRHFPQNDGLEANKTYWYWLEVENASGQVAVQNTDKPFVVIRETGYRVGPYYDDLAADGAAYTWMVAGGPVANIDGVNVNTGVNGAIYKGSTLSSVVSPSVSSVYEFLEQVAVADRDTSGNAMKLSKVWQVAIRGVNEGFEAYKEDIFVKLNTDAVEGFDTNALDDYKLFMLDDSGQTWRSVDLMDAAAAASVGITDVAVEATGITFKLTGTNTTGNIGVFGLAKRMTQEETDYSFRVTPQFSSGGQINNNGGAFAYGAHPMFVFDPYPGYKVDSVALLVGGGSSRSGQVRYEIPHVSQVGAQAPYGTYSGNTYTFPADFNDGGSMSDVTFSVTFTKADSYVPPAQGQVPAVQLTAGNAPQLLTDVPHGSVYFGAKINETRVNAGETKRFEANKTYGSFTMKTNDPMMLYFEPVDGCKVESVTINGETHTVYGSSYVIPSFNTNMSIKVNFAFTMIEPVFYFKVKADYDSSQARVGFGQSGVQWVDSISVAQGDHTTFIVEPHANYVLQSAVVSYGEGTSETDATTWISEQGILTVPNIQRDTIVSFVFKKTNEPPVPVPADTFTVTARAVGKGGFISGSGTAGTLSATVQAGGSYTINYQVHLGYRVVSITDNGKSMNFSLHDRSYTVFNIAENHDVVIAFDTVSSCPPAGVISPTKRIIHRLQSLAKTGDLNVPIAISFAAVAVVAGGTAVFLLRRRKRAAS